jgi:hypothetical protein
MLSPYSHVNTLLSWMTLANVHIVEKKENTSFIVMENYEAGCEWVLMDEEMDEI